MTAAQLQTREGPSPDDELRVRFVQARFEALAEWGIPLDDAHRIADRVTVDIVEVVGLLREGCPASLVLPILS